VIKSALHLITYSFTSNNPESNAHKQDPQLRKSCQGSAAWLSLEVIAVNAQLASRYIITFPFQFSSTNTKYSPLERRKARIP
jgi:hypothetical protein